MKQPTNPDDESLLSKLCEMEEYLLGEQASLPTVDDDSLTDEQRIRLQDAEQALHFLRRARQNYAIVNDSTGHPSGSEEESVASSTDSTQSETQAKFLADQVTPQRIGRFEILDVLGQGGFSRVFLARDPDLDRLVALKVPRPGAIADETSRQRFQREARAAAVLSHPAIVPTYEAGAIGPITYLAMGYCRGKTLAARVESQPVSPREAAEITLELALAIEHAHQRGIVHRDLKPSNILVESVGNIEASRASDSSSTLRRDNGPLASRLRITDFGLAKYDSQDLKLTQEGMIVGTPAYMSPEQASANREVGPATDIYSLGTMLFELLAGQLPFRRDSPLATLRAVETEPVPNLRKINSDLPTDLCSIAEKCLQKDPNERYESAFALAEDLQRLMQGMPIQARRVGSIEQFSKWCRRRPALASSLAFAFLSLALGFGLTAWKWREANDSFLRERDAREAAVSARKDTDAFSDYLVFSVLSAARPKGQDGGLGIDVKLVDALESAESDLAKYFKDRPEAESIARNALGNTWRKLGKMERAEEHFRIAKALTSNAENSQTGTHESDRSGAILAQLESASMVASRGKFDEALQMLAQTESDAKKYLRKDHPLAIGCKNNRAAILINQGNYDKATPIFEELLEFFTENQGAESPTTAKIRGNLAVSYRYANELESAIELLEYQLDFQLAKLGEEDYGSLQTMAELGDCYTRAKRLEKGNVLLEKAQRISKKIMGDDHPRTLVVMTYLAANRSAREEFDSAIELNERAVELSTNRYGAEHQESYMCQVGLVDIYIEAGRSADAEALAREIVARQEAIGIPDSHQLLYAKRQLADAFLHQGKNSEAIDLLQHLVKRYGAKYGADNRATLEVVKELEGAEEKARSKHP